MAYRAPRYSYVHAARDVGASEITLDGDSADADFPVDNLIDDRAGTLFKFSGSVVSPRIDVDLGVGPVTGIDRIIIPANHNLVSIRVREASDAGFTADVLNLFTTKSPTPGALIDVEFDTASSERYLRLEIFGTAVYQLPQLVYTKIMELDVGPVLADALDALKANVTRVDQKTGISPTVQDGPDQRILEYVYKYALSNAGASTDLTDIEALIASVGMYRPFFVDPASFSTPPETDEPVLWMKFQEMPDSRLAVDVPMSQERSKTYSLRLIESLD